MMKKIDEESGGGEMTPLNSRASFCSSEASSNTNTGAAAPDNDAKQQPPPQRVAQVLTRQAAASITLGLLGWYGPKYYTAHYEHDIQQRPVPYQTTTAGDIIVDFLLNQPLVEPPTIPSNFLIQTSVWLPIVLILVVSWLTLPSIRQQQQRGGCNNNWSSLFNSLSRNPATTAADVQQWQFCLHGRLCAFFTAIGLSEGLTQVFKLLVKRRRPNFYALCGWDVAQKACTASLHDVREANFSFPSGHSSLSCCAMSFIIWLLLGIILVAASSSSSSCAGTSCCGGCGGGNNVAATAKGAAPERRVLGIETLQLSAFCVTVFPLSWTLFVGASRLMDHWHHPADVVAGLVLGGVCGTVAYHLWFPPIWSHRHVPSHPWSLHFLLSGSGISGGGNSGIIGRPALLSASSSSMGPSAVELLSSATTKHTSFNE